MAEPTTTASTNWFDIGGKLLDTAGSIAGAVIGANKPAPTLGASTPASATGALGGGNTTTLLIIGGVGIAAIIGVVLLIKK